jgi:hypothetical protein
MNAAAAREIQRTEELLEAIRDWAISTGAARSINRRWAMRLLQAELHRRDASRAELAAAVSRNTRRLAA